MEIDRHYTMFKNYHEAAKDFAGGDISVYGRLMFILNSYGIDGIIPEDLTREEKMFFTLIKANIDKSIEISEKRSRARSGKSPVNNTESDTSNSFLHQNNLINKNNFCKNEKEKEIEVEVEVEKEIEVEVEKEFETDTKECAPSETLSKDIGEFQKNAFSLIQEHNKNSPPEKKIAVSAGFIGFIQKESRMILNECQGEDIKKVFEAFKNYLKIAKLKNTWKKTFSIKDFAKNFAEYKTGFFSIEKFISKSAEEKTGASMQNVLKTLENDSRFDFEFFTMNQTKWKNSGSPTGEKYFEWQKKCKESV